MFGWCEASILVWFSGTLFHDVPGQTYLIFQKKGGTFLSCNSYSDVDVNNISKLELIMINLT